jgi:hypothetical protein
VPLARFDLWIRDRKMDLDWLLARPPSWLHVKVDVTSDALYTVLDEHPPEARGDPAFDSRRLRRSRADVDSEDRFAVFDAYHYLGLIAGHGYQLTHTVKPLDEQRDWNLSTYRGALERVFDIPLNPNCLVSLSEARSRLNLWNCVEPRHLELLWAWRTLIPETLLAASDPTKRFVVRRFDGLTSQVGRYRALSCLLALWFGAVAPGTVGSPPAEFK